MRRLLPLSGAVVALLTIVAPDAAAHNWGIKAGGESLTDAGGQVVLSTGGSADGANDWHLSGSISDRKPMKLELRGGKRTGQQLVQPCGDDHAVGLSPRPAGTEWRILKVEGKSRYTIQAVGGKYDGWYLDAGDEVKDDKGRVYGSKAVLRKAPKKPLEFSIFEIAP